MLAGRRGAFRPLAIRQDVFPGHRRCDTPGSQKAPSAKRCIKTQVSERPHRGSLRVRKHRAPKGALRLAVSANAVRTPITCQKAPSAKRCIKTLCTASASSPLLVSQKAPSAKRCIKTSEALTSNNTTILGQKAPSAKRCIKTWYSVLLVRVSFSQKAPSAKRCIKTTDHLVSQAANLRVRKHRAPNGALKLLSMTTKRHVLFQVRKHRAPNGALKHQAVDQPEQEV